VVVPCLNAPSFATPSPEGKNRLPAPLARVESVPDRYTSGIPPICLYAPSKFPHARFMATLSSNSTDAQVLAAYDDNASYEEDNSRAKADAFITACRILRNRLPLSAGRGPQTFTRESLQAEIEAAQRWKDAHPATAGSGSGRVRYLSMENFRG